MKDRRISKRKILLLFGDLGIILASIYFAYGVRYGRWFSVEEFNKYVYLWFVFSMTYVFSFYVFDQYNIRIKFLRSRSLFMYVGSLTLVSLVIIGCFYVFPFNIGRGIFVLSFIFTSVFAFFWRNVYSSVFRLAFPKRKVLLIDGGRKEEELHNLLKESQDYEVIGVLSDKGCKRNPGFTHLGKINEIEKVVDHYGVDDIVTSLEPTSSDRLIHGLVTSKMRGISIYDLPTFYEGLKGQLPVLRIEEKWLFYSNGFEHLGDKLYKRVKRILDFSVSVIILILSLPFSLVTALLIKIDSRGPVFYIQERLRQNEKSFRLIKFRTMVRNAEGEKPKWAKEKDKRVTRIGRILRKTRIDELPQLINIFKGEMSVIGPRPEREYFVKKLKKAIPFYALRFSVKPGLTGWAQVNYRYGASVEDAMEKMRYDLYYIKNMSLFLDFRILLRTIRICLFGMGR